MIYKISDEQILKELYNYTMKRAPHEWTMNYVGEQYGIWYLNNERKIVSHWDLRSDIAGRYNLSKATALNAFKRLAKKGVITEDFSNETTYRYSLCESVINQINIKTKELLNNSGLSKKPKKLTKNEITKIWNKTTNDLVNSIPFNDVLDISKSKELKNVSN